MTNELIGSTEAAQLADIKPSTFRSLVAAGDKTKTPVPTPIIRGSQGQTTLWQRADIVEWAKHRNRTTGKERNDT